MINATCLDIATKLQNCKKMHSRYVYVTHTCLDVATKPEKLQKKELMIYVALAAKPENHKKNIHVTIYIHIIHVRLDIALMEGNLYPL